MIFAIIDNAKKILIIALIVIIGVFLYNHFTGKSDKNTQTIPARNTVIDTVPVAHEQQTIIKYVERPADDNAQVDIQNEQPKLIARYNDTEYVVPSTVKETSLLENGQIKINQEATAKIDITAIVKEQMEQERKALLAKSNRPNELKGAVLAGSSSLYVGAEYEAKMWDAGIYQRVAGDGDKRLIKGSATIARW
ncbi:MAG: hypothetical protein AB9883_07450 [Acidaminococcaceae bacterium]